MDYNTSTPVFKFGDGSFRIYGKKHRLGTLYMLICRSYVSKTKKKNHEAHFLFI